MALEAKLAGAVGGLSTAQFGYSTVFWPCDVGNYCRSWMDNSHIPTEVELEFFDSCLAMRDVCPRNLARNPIRVPTSANGEPSTATITGPTDRRRHQRSNGQCSMSEGLHLSGDAQWLSQGPHSVCRYRIRDLPGWSPATRGSLDPLFDECGGFRCFAIAPPPELELSAKDCAKYRRKPGACHRVPTLSSMYPLTLTVTERSKRTYSSRRCMEQPRCSTTWQR